LHVILKTTGDISTTTPVVLLLLLLGRSI